MEEHFGISLGEDKRSLVVGRLRSIVQGHGYSSFDDYAQRHLAEPSHRVLVELSDCLTTNHTYFYRESVHFDFLTETVLGQVADNQRGSHRDLRMWCAAASTGEEPYTLAMLLKEYFGLDYGNWQAGILATDVSTRALRVASRGIYETTAIQPLPASLRKYFCSRDGNHVEVIPEIKSQVTLRRFNLKTPKFSFKQPFHVIFCRNVMMYFGDKMRTQVVQQLAKVLRPRGYLFIGLAESLGSRQSDLQRIAAGIYQKA